MPPCSRASEIGKTSEALDFLRTKAGRMIVGRVDVRSVGRWDAVRSRFTGPLRTIGIADQSSAIHARVPRRCGRASVRRGSETACARSARGWRSACASARITARSSVIARHRIVAAATPRLAAQEPSDRESRPVPSAVSFQSLDRIERAARREAALPAHQGTEHHLVPAHAQDQGSGCEARSSTGCAGGLRGELFLLARFCHVEWRLRIAVHSASR